MGRKRDLDVFKEEFEFWASKLQLDDYDLTFAEDKAAEEFAYIMPDCDVRAAHVCLGKVPRVKERRRHIQDTALHEALHLLLAEFSDAAHDRFINEKELGRIEEGLVVKLTKILSSYQRQP